MRADRQSLQLGAELLLESCPQLRDRSFQCRTPAQGHGVELKDAIISTAAVSWHSSGPSSSGVVTWKRRSPSTSGTTTSTGHIGASASRRRCLGTPPFRRPSATSLTAMCSADSSTSTTSWPRSPSGSLWRLVDTGRRPRSCANDHRVRQRGAAHHQYWLTSQRAPFEVLEIPRTKRRRPTLNAVSAIEVLVPYTTISDLSAPNLSH